jgi:hypothetical protein
MQVAEESLKLIRQMQTNSKESSCMNAYFNALNEVEEMKKELGNFPNKEHRNYKLKEKRVKIIENSIHEFYGCYFNMAKYKEAYATWKHKALEKEFELTSFLSKNV